MKSEEYIQKTSLEYNLQNYDEGGYLGIDDGLLISSLNEYAKIQIIEFTKWLCVQNLMISEGADGYTFRSSMNGGKKYSAEELYQKFISENDI